MYSWDARKARSNLEKHGISFDEAVSVFDDDTGLEWEDLAHEGPERRWKRLGFSEKARLILVVYTLRRLKNNVETIRIISARHASQAERESYAG